MKSLRIAVQMDPIEKMIVNHDTSLALMVEAQARGHEIWWWTPDDLFYELGIIKANARRVSVSAEGACRAYSFASFIASSISASCGTTRDTIPSRSASCASTIRPV